MARQIHLAGALEHGSDGRWPMAALHDGFAHVAGVHLQDRPWGEPNLAAVRRAVPRTELSLITLASWHAGLLLARGDLLRTRGAADLAPSRVRIAAHASSVHHRPLLERAPTFSTATSRSRTRSRSAARHCGCQ